MRLLRPLLTKIRRKTNVHRLQEDNVFNTIVYLVPITALLCVLAVLIVNTIKNKDTEE